jgi:threonine dehydratase
MEEPVVTLQAARAAAERIRPYIRHTPLLRQQNMDARLGCEVYLKPEMLQVIGAFKIRGALNKILSLPPEERQKGIITSSSGNHGQACAYVGRMLGIHVTVVVPEDTPRLKIDNARAMGAEVIEWERTYPERWKKVHAEVAEHGYTIAHPYEDYTVMAGQATVGLEILEDLPDVETVMVPIGGGGLISGVSTAIKESNPKIRVVGVQPENCPVYYISRQEGHRCSVPRTRTIADGLSCAQAGEKPYPIIEKYVDEIVTVTEDEILDGVRLLGRDAKLVAEPSAAVTVSALMHGKVKTRADEKVACVLTSGNWDIDIIGRILAGENVTA